jgi:hypothetical protein
VLSGVPFQLTKPVQFFVSLKLCPPGAIAVGTSG